MLPDCSFSFSNFGSVLGPLPLRCPCLALCPQTLLSLRLFPSFRCSVRSGPHLRVFPNRPAHSVTQQMFTERLLCARCCSKGRGITYQASSPVLFNGGVSHSVGLFCSFSVCTLLPAIPTRIEKPREWGSWLPCPLLCAQPQGLCRALGRCSESLNESMNASYSPNYLMHSNHIHSTGQESEAHVQAMQRPWS